MSEKLSITFSTVPELLLKADQIRDFAIQQKFKRKSKLDELGVVYEELNDYGFAIDIDKNIEKILAIKEMLSDDTLREFVDKLES